MAKMIGATYVGYCIIRLFNGDHTLERRNIDIDPFSHVYAPHDNKYPRYIFMTRFEKWRVFIPVGAPL